MSLDNKKTRELSERYPVFKRVEELTKGSNCSVAHLVNCMTEEEAEIGLAQIKAERAKNPGKLRAALRKNTLKVFGKECIT